MIVGIIRRKPVLTYASIIFGDMLASVNSVKKINSGGSSSLAIQSGEASSSEYQVNISATADLLFGIPTQD